MPNGHGGSRLGAGRPPGRRDRPVYVADPDNMQPLDYMLEQLRDESAPDATRMDAAKAAAPYCHARLAQTDLQVDADLNIMLVSYLDENRPDSQPEAA